MVISSRALPISESERSPNSIPVPLLITVSSSAAEAVALTISSSSSLVYTTGESSGSSWLSDSDDGSRSLCCKMSGTVTVRRVSNAFVLEGGVLSCLGRLTIFLGRPTGFLPLRVRGPDLGVEDSGVNFGGWDLGVFVVLIFPKSMVFLERVTLFTGSGLSV